MRASSICLPYFSLLFSAWEAMQVMLDIDSKTMTPSRETQMAIVGYLMLAEEAIATPSSSGFLEVCHRPLLGPPLTYVQLVKREPGSVGVRVHQVLTSVHR